MTAHTMTTTFPVVNAPVSALRPERSSRPTLAELRAGAQKGRHREIGNWLARRWGRPAAIYGTWLAVRLGLSAHQVTMMAWCASFAASVAIATGRADGFLMGAALAHLAFWLDHVDGQVARWRGSASLDGTYLDYLMHHAANLTLGFALGLGLAVRSGDVGWTIAGFSIGAGWLFLGLQNDCRYKAFFQRLKAASGSFRVEGGAGGRPAPPARWPRRGRAALTWPAYKACEPHVVLVGLTMLAPLALVAADAWLALWRVGTLAFAVLAPALAAARIARAIQIHAVEEEFARWFRPVDGPITAAESSQVRQRRFLLDTPRTVALARGTCASCLSPVSRQNGP